MTQRRYEDDVVSEFERRIWPVIDVEARLLRAARAAERARATQRRLDAGRRSA